MTDPLLTLPLDCIDDTALPRDRTGLDPAPLAELRRSILAGGLRQPVEVFALPEGAARPYGLISGFRRLTVLRALAAEGHPGADTVPAFLRRPAGMQGALAAMVEENEVRADISAWEKGLMLVSARDAGIFDTVDAAIDGLHPGADRTRKSRLRALAEVVEALDGLLSAPETLTQRQCQRLATALRAGFGALIETALTQSKAREPARQWRLIEPVLLEAEAAARSPAPRRPGRPRRLLTPRPGLTIRRELAPEGWILRCTGPDARSDLLDEILSEIERMFSPG